MVIAIAYQLFFLSATGYINITLISQMPHQAVCCLWNTHNMSPAFLSLLLEKILLHLIIKCKISLYSILIATE